jgi:8-amino-7-oxononanoate synthase
VLLLHQITKQTLLIILKSGYEAAFFIFAETVQALNSAERYIEDKLEARKAAGNYRQLKPESSLIDFCSNDYLGFAHSAELKQMIRAEEDRHPSFLNGSTGSRLLTGNSAYAEELEAQIAVWHQAEAGLLFNSGYDANIGLLSSLAQRGDTIICDELIHASLIDGARLSYANRYTFKHNDPTALEEKLKNAKGITYVVIESVYSMDGDIAPIAEMLELTEQYSASLIVDEAHALGVFHKGLVNQLNLQNRIFARIMTFGKALGCHGAIVLGSSSLRNYLINFSRSFIYSTAASFNQLAAIKMGYELLRGSEETIAQLRENIRLFKQQITSTQMIESTSAIQCLMAGTNEKAAHLSQQLKAAGIDARPILSPTVAAGTERLRICLHSFNTPHEITLLTTIINQLS